jgi:methylmalonyl-CoA mutase
LSAVLGGVDSLCVGTFDETLREPNDFSRRLARNLQVILQEECGLTRTIDPAGGAWGIEWMTRQLSERAWTLFQEIEAAGGIAEALENGWVAERLRGADEASRKALSQRRRRLIGTNVYARSEETPLDPAGTDYREIRNQRAREVADQRLSVGTGEDTAILEALGRLVDAPPEKKLPEAIEAAARGATLGEICRALRSEASSGTPGKPLPALRLAQAYEALRQGVGDYRQREGATPRLLLLNWGPVRRHQARNDFSRGFFEAGGFEVLSSESVTTVTAAVEAVTGSGATLVVLCGHDEDYLEHFDGIARALKRAQPDLFLVLAGHPGEAEARFREAGMDDFIHLKSDHLQTNRKYLQDLGVL